MPIQQVLPMPPIYNLRKNVTVSIRIWSEGKGYEVSIQTNWSQPHQFSIEPTPHDVEELNLGLQEALEQVSRKFGTDEYNDAVSNLAKKGDSAFKWIFRDKKLREKISEVLKTGATIEFSSEDFFIPWELLYDGPLGAEVDVLCFWGMRNVISRDLIQKNGLSDLSDLDLPTEHQSLSPRVGLITYNELKHVLEKEIPALQELERQKKILLSCLRPLKTNQYYDELEYFGRFLGDQGLHIVHLACHAQAIEPPRQSQSYLRISDKFSITIEDFRGFEMKNHPLVILNACLTGTIDPLYTSNWAVWFWKNGARGVLATEFYVPDWFAAAFIVELYKELLSDKPIGEVVLETRRYFWEKHHNLLGLAYALYARSFISVIHCGPSE